MSMAVVTWQMIMAVVALATPPMRGDSHDHSVNDGHPENAAEKAVPWGGLARIKQVAAIQLQSKEDAQKGQTDEVDDQGGLQQARFLA